LKPCSLQVLPGKGVGDNAIAGGALPDLFPYNSRQVDICGLDPQQMAKQGGINLFSKRFTN
jgi:hypothetical protein